MPSSGTEVHTFSEVWTKRHLSIPGKDCGSEAAATSSRIEDELLHLKCRLINTAGNEQSEVDVRLPLNKRGSPVFTLGRKERPTLDEVLGSIPLVYNPSTRQLQLGQSGDGTCLSMDCNGPSLPRDSAKSCDESDKVLFLDKAETLGRKMEEAQKDYLEAFVSPSPTSASLQHTDTSSFTSMSSVGTKSGSNLSLCYSCDNLQSLDAHKGTKPKKWGLSNLFQKFPWKSKAPLDDETFERCPSACSSGSRRSDECIATSTTALILENRPPNLPAKSAEEEVKHKQLYEEMIRGARKKELQDAKIRKKQAYQQQKLEELLINATKTWNDDILPNWKTSRDNRKTRDLWWKGLPPSIRGKVWKLAIGNDLNITPELFDICTARSKGKIWVTTDVKVLSEVDEPCVKNESAADFIKLDVSRTFPQLGIFQEGGPYYNILEGILGAYVIYRPDIGYVQGMSFLAAMLLLNMDAVDTFICFCNLLNRQCHLSFFRVEQKMMCVYYSVFEEYLKENLPKLSIVFEKQNLSPDLYLVDWLYTLYSKSLPLDVASRVWDVYLRDGEEFLIKTALGILKLYEDVLLEMDFIHLAQFLTKLPEEIDSERLFACIGTIRMTLNKKPFSHVLQQHILTL